MIWYASLPFTIKTFSEAVPRYHPGGSCLTFTLKYTDHRGYWSHMVWGCWHLERIPSNLWSCDGTGPVTWCYSSISRHNDDVKKIGMFTEKEKSSFWWNVHHWLHWKLSKWQCSQWWKFHQNDDIFVSVFSPLFSPHPFPIGDFPEYLSYW